MAGSSDEAMARLEAAGIEERAAFMAEGQAPTALRHLGVPMPKVHLVVRGLARGEVSRDLICGLVETGTVEGRLVAYKLCWIWRGQLVWDAAGLEQIGARNDNRVTVDTFASCATGPAWVSGGLSDEDIDRWIVSPDRWWRRTALLSTVPWNRKSLGGVGDTSRTLRVVGQVVADRDPFVVKAVWWALRELVAWDPEAVRGFLEEEDVAVQIRREVTRELSKGE